MLRRLLICILLSLVVVGCGRQTLFVDVPQKDANEILTILEKSGVGATLAPGTQPQTVTISVPSGDMTTAVQVLARVGLPRPKDTSLNDIIPQDAWMVSKTQENARLAFGIGQDLSGTLRQINGIMEARVHVALAQKNSIDQIVIPPSASVLVRYDESLIGPEFQTDIASLVSNAVSGLTFDRVSVTMVPYVGGASFKVNSGAVTSQSSTVGVFLQLLAAVVLAGLLARFLFTRTASSKS